MNLLKIKKAINETGPYLKNFFRISVAVFVFGFLLSSSVYLLPSTKIVKAEMKESVSKIDLGQTSGKSILEVHIASNGMVFLQGARVQSISGTTIVVGTSWGGIDLNWKILTNHSVYGKRNFGTSFLDSKGKVVDMKYIRMGDTITVNGILDVNSTEMAIKADVVRI